MQATDITPRPGRGRFRIGSVSRGDLIGAASAVAGSLLAATFSLQLWHMHLGIPLVYQTGNDSLFEAALVKLVLHGTGWIYTNRQIGAPFGLNFGDFPLGTDNLNYATMWIIGRFTGNVGAVENIWFLCTFAVEALTAYAVMRWMNISVPSAVVAAVLFADAPFHLFSSEAHLLLSDYVTVPIAIYLCLSVLDGRQLVTGGLRASRVRSVLTGRNLWMLLLVVVIGSTGVYYAFFTVILLGAAGLVAALRLRQWRPFVQALVVLVAIFAVAGLNDAPSTIYRLANGSNAAVAKRPASDSEAYGLKLSAMALPVSGDRIQPLASVRAKYDNDDAVPSENQTQELGTLGTLGLAWLLLVALGAVAGNISGPLAEFARRRVQLAFLALVAFVFATIGGLSAVIAYLFFNQIRDWNRISIFIDLLALVTVAMALDAIARRWLKSRPVGAVALAVAVGAFGVLDQSSLDAIPTYQATAATWNSAAQFDSRIQSALPAGSSVFQLPYISFPEAPAVNNAWSYDQFAGWLHTSDLNWSFPAMRGRPTDWDSQTLYMPTSTLLDGIVAAGFSGIWIDRYGYPDNQSPLIQQLQGELDEAPLNSPDGRYAFFDVRSYAAALRARASAAKLAGLRQAVLNPVVSEPTAGIYGTGTGSGTSGGSTWAVSTVQISVSNNLDRPRAALFYAEVRTPVAGSYELTVDLPGGGHRRFAIGPTQRLIEFQFTLPPGAGTITLNTNAPSTEVPGLSAPTSIWYSEPYISGTGVEPFLSRTASTDLQ